jgi:aerobic carbon-monoxide dehydrogenase large subunit
MFELTGFSIGKPLRRRDDERLLRGLGQYGTDVRLPDMLSAAVVRSPMPHARIRGIRVEAARELPGVEAVFVAADLGTAQRPIASFGQWPKDLLEACRPQLRPAPLYPLADNRVRHVGQPVALVVARDRYIAEDAAELVEVDYEPLPAVATAEAAIAPDAPILYDGWDDNIALQFSVRLGDIDAAVDGAAHVLSERFYSHRYSGVPLEGRAITAAPGPQPFALTVHSSHQMPHLQRVTICEALELPEFAVQVRQTDIGGGFGQKAGLYPEDVLIPFAAYKLGRPVKWTEDRAEHFQSSSHSREQSFDVEVAFDAHGKLLGLRYRVLIDGGAYLTFPVVLPYLGLCHMLGPYKIPALDADIQTVLTNKVTSAPYRGAGRPEVTFVMNRVMDRIAGELDLDPVEVRHRNFIQPWEMPYRPGLAYRDGAPMVLDSGDYPDALERLLDALDYDATRAQIALDRERGVYRGVGIACNVEATGIGPWEGARVGIDPTGGVAVYIGVGNSGQGHETVFAQVCAEVLEVDPQNITVFPADTSTLGFSRGSYHSRAAVTAGSAVHSAAIRVREKARLVAAHVLEASPSDLEFADGEFRVKGSPGSTVSLARIAQLSAPGMPLPPDVDPGLDETAYANVPSATWGHGAHGAVVEVDPETGGVEILRYVVVHDCGTLLNPMIVAGQIHGGVAAGIGGTLLEELVYDDDAQLITTSFMDYLLPTLSDVPHVEVIHTETPSPLNPLGVKGAGEGGTVAPPAALAAAVEDALSPLGVRITRTPLGPRNILNAIREARAASAETQ